jgi:asparagine synthase (glutamine-hydrolysing)
MFALAIQQGGELFLARPFGYQAAVFARQDGKLYFASEIKALAPVSPVVHEFPAGYWFHSRLGWQQYFRLERQDKNASPFASQEEAARQILATMTETVRSQLMSDVPLGVSLSGGLDSSVVAQLACQGMSELFSFAVGVAGSPDLLAARQVAGFLGTKHFEMQYTESDMVEVLPKVLYALESFDPALVRSAIPNYFLAQLASQHVKVILTGEGADELYAGYEYLATYTEGDALENELIHITNALHNTNLQRADRISMAWGLEARPPFLDTRSVRLAFKIPAEWKLTRPAQPAKHLLRQAFDGLLPQEILQRPKQKFSQGAGSSHILALRAAETVSDADFTKERTRLKAEWNFNLKSKEALYYYRKLAAHYPDEVLLPNTGQSRSL